MYSRVASFARYVYSIWKRSVNTRFHAGLSRYKVRVGNNALVSPEILSTPSREFPRDLYRTRFTLSLLVTNHCAPSVGLKRVSRSSSAETVNEFLSLLVISSVNTYDCTNEIMAHQITDEI